MLAGLCLQAENDNFVAEKTPQEAFNLTNMHSKKLSGTVQSARRPIQNPMFIFHYLLYLAEGGGAPMTRY